MAVVVNLHFSFFLSLNEIQLYDKLGVGHQGFIHPFIIIIIIVTEHILISYVPAGVGPDVASLVIARLSCKQKLKELNLRLCVALITVCPASGCSVLPPMSPSEQRLFKLSWYLQYLEETWKASAAPRPAPAPFSPVAMSLELCQILCKKCVESRMETRGGGRHLKQDRRVN